MQNPKDRPVKTCAELCEAGSPNTAPQACLMTAKEFLKMVSLLSGQKAKRRGHLQFYSSPAHRLLPLPIYLNRHTAHYLHPENTVRFAVLLHLRAAYYLPLDLAKVVLDGLPEEHYDLILNDILSAADIVRLARDGGPKPWLKDVLLGRGSRALHAADRLVKEPELASPPLAMADHQKVLRRAPALAAADLAVAV
jgi:hypothetical protein